MTRTFFYRLTQVWLVLALGWGMAACADDEDPLPAYVQTLAELRTGPAGEGRQTLVLEDGTQQPVLNPVSGLPADYMLRVYAICIPRPDRGGVELYDVQSVFSPQAIPMDTVDTLHTDPVRLISLWKTGRRWVNFHLGIPRGSDVEHTCGFVCEWLPQRPEGGVRLRLTLYHDAADDPALYTAETYFSCPVYQYAGLLRAGIDSLEVCVNTTSGRVVRRFVY